MTTILTIAKMHFVNTNGREFMCVHCGDAYNTVSTPVYYCKKSGYRICLKCASNKSINNNNKKTMRSPEKLIKIAIDNFDTYHYKRAGLCYYFSTLRENYFIDSDETWFLKHLIYRHRLMFSWYNWLFRGVQTTSRSYAKCKTDYFWNPRYQKRRLKYLKFIQKIIINGSTR